MMLLADLLYAVFQRYARKTAHVNNTVPLLHLRSASADWIAFAKTSSG
jgi:hypothetical protein